MQAATLKRLVVNLRKVHRRGALLAALPVFVIVVTGIVLLVRREFEALQPQTRQGERPGMALSLERLGAIALEEIKQRHPPAEPLPSIKELRVLPQQGVTKVRMKDWQEVQIDNHTGAVLFVGKSWSSLLVGLHEGSYFSLAISYLVYLPASLLLLALWASGLLIYWGGRRWKMMRKLKAGQSTT